MAVKKPAPAAAPAAAPTSEKKRAIEAARKKGIGLTADI